MKQELVTTGRIKSDKVQRSGMPLPEAGRIKIGMKVTNGNGKEYPTSLDYFRATGTFANQFHQIMGEKPEKIMVVFISDNVADSCNEEYACWENGKRWGWGDGETFNVWDSTAGKDKKGDYVVVDKDSPLLKGKKWDITLTLRFILPMMKGVLAHWVFATKGSKTTIPGIVQAFDFVKERMGTVIGVPFELAVEKAKGYSPGQARQYSKVKLVPCISEAYMEKVRDFLSAGKSLSEIAPLMVSESKLLAEGTTNQLNAPAIEMETIEETAAEVVDEGSEHVKEAAQSATEAFLQDELKFDSEEEEENQGGKDE